MPIGPGPPSGATICDDPQRSCFAPQHVFVGLLDGAPASGAPSAQAVVSANVARLESASPPARLREVAPAHARALSILPNAATDIFTPKARHRRRPRHCWSPKAHRRRPVRRVTTVDVLEGDAVSGLRSSGKGLSRWRPYGWRSATRVPGRRRYSVRGSTAKERAGCVATLLALIRAPVALLVVPLPARITA